MTPTGEELLRSACALVPTIADSAAEGERERRVPPRIVAALKEAGIFRALQPKRWGGYELPPTALYDAEMAVAAGDMSTAWVVGVLGIIPWAVALFDDRAGAEIWGEDDSSLVCCALRRAGTAIPVEGGFRLSGQWAYASGCQHAGWALLGGSAGPPPDGDYLMLVPRRDFEILDTWQVAGLKATGSNDVVVKDAFIPQHRAHRMVDLFDCRGPGQAINTAALYRMPFGLVFAGGVANAAVGALQGMLDRLVGEIAAKRGPRRPDPDVTLVCAEAATTVDEAKAVVARNFARLMAHAERGALPPIEERLQVKYQLSLNTERCRLAANKLLEASGASGLYTSRHPYGRIVADITAARQHITNNLALHARDWGQVMLGQPRRHDFML
ncbi:MAG TPA: acyl-CoA dehydrogenase family protein [Stellaceae bacterium]|nr:acyl-CoA dehydrogenase family protein [Stellaceae bacterium]